MSLTYLQINWVSARHQHLLYLCFGQFFLYLCFGDFYFGELAFLKFVFVFWWICSGILVNFCALLMAFGWICICIWCDQGCIWEQASANFERLGTCCLLRCRFKQHYNSHLPRCWKMRQMIIWIFGQHTYIPFFFANILTSEVLWKEAGSIVHKINEL